MNGAPSMGAILVADDAEGRHWQLGEVSQARGRFALVGWTMEEADGGTPALVARTLARALTRYGRVTFPSSVAPYEPGPRWHAHDQDYVATLPLQTACGWRAALASLRGPSELRLISTLREQTVVGMFDDGAYPWWHQGQFALLSRPATTPPDLAGCGVCLSRVVEHDWTEHLEGLSEAGVEAILRPGVDGRVAGLLCTSRAVRQDIEDAIRGAAADFGLACHVLSEDDFARELAGAT